MAVPQFQPATNVSSARFSFGMPSSNTTNIATPLNTATSTNTTTSNTTTASFAFGLSASSNASTVAAPSFSFGAAKSLTAEVTEVKTEPITAEKPVSQEGKIEQSFC